MESPSDAIALLLNAEFSRDGVSVTNLICGQEIVYGYANNIQLENRKNTTGYALEKENTYGTV